MQNRQFFISKGQVIDNKYTVQFYLKKGTYTWNFRVVDNDQKIKILKLFDYNKLHRTHLTTEGEILEINILKELDHPNLLKIEDHGIMIIENKKFAYAVLDFISGETLLDKLSRKNRKNPYDAKQIVLGVLNGLNFLHSNSIIHNNINSQNVMLELSGKIPIPKIISFGYARYFYQNISAFYNEGLNPYYTANEGFNNIFSYQSDIFSVGALYYHLLEGKPPWFVEISKFSTLKNRFMEDIHQVRKKPLTFSTVVDKSTELIIRKALHSNAEYRFDSANEFSLFLQNEKKLELSSPENYVTKPESKVVKKGKGFSAIAGMQELKENIKFDVIDALNQKEKYAEYGLSIPNGMLLYGPPGCGKTFFAERLAEEIDFTFYSIKPSDIQSKWVNASQENVRNLFDEARENSPSIIFIDEIDAVVPSRDTTNISLMNANVVNEFLAQMNNCGEDGIFIIGATNRPHAIDPAILRAGRLDKKIYIPVPDFEARKELFRWYLKNRPLEIGIDYEELALLTEDFASVDIKNISDECAREALKKNIRISFDMIVDIIKRTLSSLTIEELNRYRASKNMIEKGSTGFGKTRQIGFKT